MAVVIKSEAGMYSTMETRIPLSKETIDGLVLYGIIRFGKESYSNPLKEDLINFLTGKSSTTQIPYYDVINIGEPDINESLNRLKGADLVEEYTENNPHFRVPGGVRLKVKTQERD